MDKNYASKKHHNSDNLTIKVFSTINISNLELRLLINRDMRKLLYSDKYHCKFGSDINHHYEVSLKGKDDYSDIRVIENQIWINGDEKAVKEILENEEIDFISFKKALSRGIFYNKKAYPFSFDTTDVNSST